jgi:rubrerythrin
VDDSKLDLAEMAFALVMRKVRQEDSEELSLRRQALESRTKLYDVEVDEVALKTHTDLRKETIEDEAHKQRLARDKDKMLRERDLAREMTSGEHQDDLTQVDHDITLEKKAAQHDIDLGDMTGEAESRAVRRGISDGSFVEDEAIRLDVKRREESIRLDAKESEQLGNIQEDLEDRKKKRRVEELRAMAEMEANMTAQEQAHELNKTKEENALARDKIDAMKNMSAAEMLALQAVDLAAKGASADMVKGITDASSGVKVAEAKEAATRELLAMQKEMMQLMLNQQNQSSLREAEALKLAVNVAQSTNEKSMDSMMQVAKVSAAESNQGYKEAAKISQSVNEKSMDSMAKVATAAAGKKTTGKDDGEPAKFECKACGAVALDSKVPKFCGNCGAKPTVD